MTDENPIKYFNFFLRPSVTEFHLGESECKSIVFKNETLERFQVKDECSFYEDPVDFGLVCESIGQAQAARVAASNTCFLNQYTIIDKKNESIHFMLDRSIDGLYFNENKAIRYLPVEVYRSFPNLVHYWANNCSIQEISRKNFEKLYNLDFIRLVGNMIKKISSDTFVDLPLLRSLALSKLNLSRSVL